jgi:hypothetical protein
VSVQRGHEKGVSKKTGGGNGFPLNSDRVLQVFLFVKSLKALNVPDLEARLIGCGKQSASIFVAVVELP